jgi:hypothetical protein
LRPSHWAQRLNPRPPWLFRGNLRLDRPAASERTDLGACWLCGASGQKAPGLNDPRAGPGLAGGPVGWGPQFPKAPPEVELAKV